MLPCINHSTLTTTYIDDFLDAAASAGFRWVELRHPSTEEYLSEHSKDRLLGRLRDLGISVAALNCLVDWSLTPEENYRVIEARAELMFAMCELIDTDLLVCVPSYLEPELVDEFPPDRVIELTSQRLRRLATMARAHGVRIGLEQVGRPSMKPTHVSSMPTVAAALQVMDAANEPNVGLVIDSHNFFTIGNRASDLANVPGNRVAMVHLADAPSYTPAPSERQRYMPGSGVLDLRGFCEQLAGTGYNGCCSVELFNRSLWERPAPDVAHEAMASLRLHLDRSSQVAIS